MFVEILTLKESKHCCGRLRVLPFCNLHLLSFTGVVGGVRDWKKRSDSDFACIIRSNISYD